MPRKLRNSKEKIITVKSERKEIINRLWVESY